MSAYASRRRHSYITNIFKCGKRGFPIGIPIPDVRFQPIKTALGEVVQCIAGNHNLVGFHGIRVGKTSQCVLNHCGALAPSANRIGLCERLISQILLIADADMQVGQLNNDYAMPRFPRFDCEIPCFQTVCKRGRGSPKH